MSDIRIIGIVGSPRKGKNTDTLVSAVLDGCRSKGAITDKIYLNELNIKPCQACRIQDGMGCRIHDDMDILEKVFNECDGIILGVPIYYGLMPAQIKLMEDRSYCLAKRVILPSDKIVYQTTVKKSKKGLLISIAHIHQKQQSIINSLSSWGNEINLKFIDNIHVRHIDFGVEAMENEKIRQTFFEHGEMFYNNII